MKKIILLTFLIIASNFAAAQNTIAKLKYEEAEEAYASSNFALALNKLKDVESLLKSMNPRLLHLKILAANKLIQLPNYEEDPELITELKKDCDFYLTKYETVQNNEDKYRDVYKVSEAAKLYVCDENLYLKAKNGDDVSLFNLARFYKSKGRFDSAIKWYEKSANLGNTRSMVNLGSTYQYNKKDITTALKWYEKSAEKGGILGMKLLGDVYSNGNGIILINAEKALFWYKKAADLANIEAMKSLGKLYKKGKIVPVNGTTAIEWYTKGIQTKPIDEDDSRQIGEIYMSMITMYCDGEAVEKNYAKVDELVNKGRQIINNDKATLAYLGEIYRIGGYGVIKDYDKAFNYYNQAVINGETAFNLIGLSEMYHKGFGVKKNKQVASQLNDKAIKLYSDFATRTENPDFDSIRKLISIYEDGIGSDKNIATANYWRTKLK